MSNNMTEFENFTVPDVIPVLPVRDMVMYPSVILPLFVGRDMSINAVEIFNRRCLADHEDAQAS
jgi:ATP-dependent Lon protease